MIKTYQGITEKINIYDFSLDAIALHWALASSFTSFVFIDHTQRHTTVGRTLLDE
jgi:hypothetical protein